MEFPEDYMQFRGTDAAQPAEQSLQVILRQRDAELEERGKLLYRTKAAIEQLQQELAASREKQEVIKAEARQAYEDQVALVRMAQSQVEACEDELAARNAEIEALQESIAQLEDARDGAEARASSAVQEGRQKLAEAQSETGAARAEATIACARTRQECEEAIAAVRAAADAQAARAAGDAQAAIAEWRRGAEAAAASAQADCSKAWREAEAARAEVAAAEAQAAAARSANAAAIAALQARLEERGAELAGAQALAEQAAARAEATGQERNRSKEQVAELTARLARLQEDATRAEQAQQASTSASAAAVAAEALERGNLARDYEKRLQRMEQECAHKIRAAERKMAKGLEEAHQEAARQAGEVAGEWRLRLAQSEEGHRALQADLAAQLDALQQRCEAQQGWEARLGEAGAKWAAEKEAAERRWDDARVSAGAAWQGALDRAQGYGAEQLALAQRRWEQERASLEVQAAKDLAQAELEAARRETKWRERCEAAEAGARETRADMERRLASLAHKLAAAAKKDEKRKRAKGEAAAAVAHARAAEAAHAARAGELECALREAAAMFKAELAVKAAEMDALHAELGRLKDQQAQTLQGASQRAAVTCSCCFKAAAVPLEATAKPLRSPVKMWISAAVDDSEENAERFGRDKSPARRRAAADGAGGMDSPWIERELQTLRAMCESNRRDQDGEQDRSRKRWGQTNQKRLPVHRQPTIT
ncbi:hypothetical protein WJX75_007750 [Coccomyxa subellipsoidea]|uniref:Uncharacterized protein n=1 Tax=Coccomyxa subellipsoidea TaxID=248742 RepID=A0ABR2Z1N5_9CHLO